MNEHFTFPPQRPATQAAEGLWRWTVAEVERLEAAGFFSEFDKFELLGGEILPMSPKGRRHELVREELYASHGIAEYWVIDATLTTSVHLRPDGDVYTAIEEFPRTERPIPSLVPAIAVSLNDLDVD